MTEESPEIGRPNIDVSAAPAEAAAELASWEAIAVAASRFRTVIKCLPILRIAAAPGFLRSEP